MYREHYGRQYYIPPNLVERSRFERPRPGPVHRSTFRRRHLRDNLFYPQYDRYFIDERPQAYRIPPDPVNGRRFLRNIVINSEPNKNDTKISSCIVKSKADLEDNNILINEEKNKLTQQNKTNRPIEENVPNINGESLEAINKDKIDGEDCFKNNTLISSKDTKIIINIPNIDTNQSYQFNFKKLFDDIQVANMDPSEAPSSCKNLTVTYSTEEELNDIATLHKQNDHSKTSENIKVVKQVECIEEFLIAPVNKTLRDIDKVSNQSGTKISFQPKRQLGCSPALRFSPLGDKCTEALSKDYDDVGYCLKIDGPSFKDNDLRTNIQSTDETYLFNYKKLMDNNRVVDMDLSQTPPSSNNSTVGDSEEFNTTITHSTVRQDINKDLNENATKISFPPNERLSSEINDFQMQCSSGNNLLMWRSKSLDDTSKLYFNLKKSVSESDCNSTLIYPVEIQTQKGWNSAEELRLLVHKIDKHISIDLRINPKTKHNDEKSKSGNLKTPIGLKNDFCAESHKKIFKRKQGYNSDSSGDKGERPTKKSVAFVPDTNSHKKVPQEQNKLTLNTYFTGKDKSIATVTNFEKSKHFKQIPKYPTGRMSLDTYTSRKPATMTTSEHSKCKGQPIKDYIRRCSLDMPSLNQTTGEDILALSTHENQTKEYVTKAEYLKKFAKRKVPTTHISLAIEPKQRTSKIKKWGKTFTREVDNAKILQKIDSSVELNKKYIFGSSNNDKASGETIELRKSCDSFSNNEVPVSNHLTKKESQSTHSISRENDRCEKRRFINSDNNLTESTTKNRELKKRGQIDNQESEISSKKRRLKSNSIETNPQLPTNSIKQDTESTYCSSPKRKQNPLTPFEEKTKKQKPQENKIHKLSESKSKSKNSLQCKNQLEKSIDYPKNRASPAEMLDTSEDLTKNKSKDGQSKEKTPISSRSRASSEENSSKSNKKFKATKEPKLKKEELNKASSKSRISSISPNRRVSLAEKLDTSEDLTKNRSKNGQSKEKTPISSSSRASSEENSSKSNKKFKAAKEPKLKKEELPIENEASSKSRTSSISPNRRVSLTEKLDTSEDLTKNRPKDGQSKEKTPSSRSRASSRENSSKSNESLKEIKAAKESKLKKEKLTNNIENKGSFKSQAPSNSPKSRASPAEKLDTSEDLTKNRSKDGESKKKTPTSTRSRASSEENSNKSHKSSKGIKAAKEPKSKKEELTNYIENKASFKSRASSIEKQDKQLDNNNKSSDTTTCLNMPHDINRNISESFIEASRHPQFENSKEIKDSSFQPGIIKTQTSCLPAISENKNELNKEAKFQKKCSGSSIFQDKTDKVIDIKPTHICELYKATENILKAETCEPYKLPKINHERLSRISIEENDCTDTVYICEAPEINNDQKIIQVNKEDNCDDDVIEILPEIDVIDLTDDADPRKEASTSAMDEDDLTRLLTQTTKELNKLSPENATITLYRAENPDLPQLSSQESEVRIVSESIRILVPSLKLKLEAESEINNDDGNVISSVLTESCFRGTISAFRTNDCMDTLKAQNISHQPNYVSSNKENVSVTGPISESDKNIQHKEHISIQKASPAVRSISVIKENLTNSNISRKEQSTLFQDWELDKSSSNTSTGLINIIEQRHDTDTLTNTNCLRTSLHVESQTSKNKCDITIANSEIFETLTPEVQASTSSCENTYNVTDKSCLNKILQPTNCNNSTSNNNPMGLQPLLPNTLNKPSSVLNKEDMRNPHQNQTGLDRNQNDLLTCYTKSNHQTNKNLAVAAIFDPPQMQHNTTLIQQSINFYGIHTSPALYRHKLINGCLDKEINRVNYYQTNNRNTEVLNLPDQVPTQVFQTPTSLGLPQNSTQRLNNGGISHIPVRENVNSSLRNPITSIYRDTSQMPALENINSFSRNPAVSISREFSDRQVLKNVTSSSRNPPPYVPVLSNVNSSPRIQNSSSNRDISYRPVLENRNLSQINPCFSINGQVANMPDFLNNNSSPRNSVTSINPNVSYMPVSEHNSSPRNPASSNFNTTNRNALLYASNNKTASQVSTSAVMDLTNNEEVSDFSELDQKKLTAILVRHLYFLSHLCKAQQNYIESLKALPYCKNYFKAEILLFEREIKFRLCCQSMKLLTELQEINIRISSNLSKIATTIVDNMFRGLPSNIMPENLTRSMVYMFLDQLFKPYKEEFARIPLIKVLIRICDVVLSKIYPRVNNTNRSQTQVNQNSVPANQQPIMNMNEIVNSIMATPPSSVVTSQPQVLSHPLQRNRTPPQNLVEPSLSMRPPPPKYQKGPGAAFITKNVMMPFSPPYQPESRRNANQNTVYTPRIIQSMLQTNATTNFSGNIEQRSSSNINRPMVCQNLHPNSNKQNTSQSLSPCFLPCCLTYQSRSKDPFQQPQESESFRKPPTYKNGSSTRLLSDVSKPPNSNFRNPNENLSNEVQFSNTRKEKESNDIVKKLSLTKPRTELTTSRASEVGISATANSVKSSIATQRKTKATVSVTSIINSLNSSNPTSVVVNSEPQTVCSTLNPGPVHNTKTITSTSPTFVSSEGSSSDISDVPKAIIAQIGSSKTTNGSFTHTENSHSFNYDSHDVEKSPIVLNQGFAALSSIGQASAMLNSIKNIHSSTRSTTENTGPKKKKIIKDKGSPAKKVKKSEVKLKQAMKKFNSCASKVNQKQIVKVKLRSFRKRRDLRNKESDKQSIPSLLTSEAPSTEQDISSMSEFTTEEPQVSMLEPQPSLSCRAVTSKCSEVVAPSEEIETIDLTWIDALDDEQLKKELNFVFVKTEDDGREREDTLLSPSDSGIASPTYQEKHTNVYTVNIQRWCVCGEAAQYQCVCSEAWYCGEECQKNDWGMHQTECQILHTEMDNEEIVLNETDKDIPET